MSAVYLPCKCGNPRTDEDTGTGRCADCRRARGEVTTDEMLRAFARCDRSRGGSTPRVGWITERCPNVIWSRRPPEKEGPIPFLLVRLDS